MRKIFSNPFVILSFLLLSLPGIKIFGQEKNTVEIAFCMDLSASTNGLIDDLRDKMWDIVNRVNEVKPQPSLRIAMVGYARPSFGETTGYAKVISDLTSDFDLVSYELFKLKSFVEKGNQQVGAALLQCLKNIHWSKNENVLKIIYLIGNGRTDQGMVDFREACEDAKEKNIKVIPVYCPTSPAAWKREVFLWKQVSSLAGTELQEIQIRKRVQEISTTDKSQLLWQLNEQLNRTFVFYGMEGYSRYKLMLEADTSSQLTDKMLFHPRLFHKISDLYLQQCSVWDLVSFSAAPGFDIEKTDRYTLPEKMQMMDDDELLLHLSSMKKQREQVLGQIRELLPLNRQEIIDSIRKEKKIHSAGTLENEVVKSFYKIASSHGFSVQ